MGRLPIGFVAAMLASGCYAAHGIDEVGAGPPRPCFVGAWDCEPPPASDSCAERGPAPFNGPECEAHYYVVLYGSGLVEGVPVLRRADMPHEAEMLGGPRVDGSWRVEADEIVFEPAFGYCCSWETRVPVDACDGDEFAGVTVALGNVIQSTLARLSTCHRVDPAMETALLELGPERELGGVYVFPY